MKRPRIDFDMMPTQDYSKDQSKGLRTGYSGRVVRGNYRFNPYKALKSGINHVTCVLQSTTQNGTFKHLVSEYDPHRGGYVSMCKKLYQSANPATAEDHVQLPMHVYDLNFYPGDNDDNNTNFPPNATNQCTNINSRMWKFTPGATFTAGHAAAGNAENECESVRYIIDNPKTANNDTQQNIKMYRKSIDIKFMLYGCTQVATKYDVRVIRITDARMCPDFQGSLTMPPAGKPVDAGEETNLRDFHQNWTNMMNDFTVNPLLKGEPGPQTRRWYTTVARKTIDVGEQTPDIETINSVQGSIKVNLNKVYDYAWSNYNFEPDNINNRFDGALPVNDNKANEAFVHKPYYTSRYYLVIRAMCTVDTSVNTEFNKDQDINLGVAFRARTFDDKGHTSTVCRYMPTYDLIVRTHWALVRNG